MTVCGDGSAIMSESSKKMNEIIDVIYRVEENK